MEKTSDKIRKLRISKNLTQQQLAQQLLVSKQAISKWEKGKCAPDVTSIEMLASFFGVSADYLINDSVEAVNPEGAVTSSVLSKYMNKLTVVLISALAVMLAAVIAVSIALGVAVNGNKPDKPVEVNGFVITYLSDETYDINKENKTISLYFNVYNSTDSTKICKKKNFAVDNGALYIYYIYPDESQIASHGELKLEILIAIKSGAENLGKLGTRSVTVKYAGQPIAKVKW